MSIDEKAITKCEHRDNVRRLHEECRYQFVCYAKYKGKDDKFYCSNRPCTHGYQALDDINYIQSGAQL